MQELSPDDRAWLVLFSVEPFMSYYVFGLARFIKEHEKLINRDLLACILLPQSDSEALFLPQVTALGKEYLASKSAIEWYRELLPHSYYTALRYICEFPLEELSMLLVDTDSRVRGQARGRLKELMRGRENG